MMIWFQKYTLSLHDFRAPTIRLHKESRIWWELVVVYATTTERPSGIGFMEMKVEGRKITRLLFEMFHGQNWSEATAIVLYAAHHFAAVKLFRVGALLYL